MWNSLLAWYEQYKRELPWRQTHDPYAILVSETMLQQTGVERVIPKYLAFLAAFPTLHALAAAPSADVIRLWSGLGYNRRAVWLQRAARSALERWGGLPAAIDDLLALPGVGPYTARAVACFAFAAQVATIDTNIRRVLTRVLHGAEETQLTAKAMQALADSVLPPGRAYDWNQALMDLGATICTHAAPRCLICPWQTMCRAFPAVQTAPASTGAAVGEARPKWKESSFVGSRRYYRGRVVEALRQLAPAQALPLATLGSLVKPDFAATELPWLRTLVEELAADGLARVEGEGVSLP
jgi:A/G-specific adenine glycosylase